MRDEEEKELTDSSLIPHPSSLRSSLRPKKSLGQNFLVDERVVDRIIRAVNPREDEVIVEIGAGRGALTSRLIERAGRIVAIEFDRQLAQLLRDRFKSIESFTVVEGDALQIDLCAAVAPATSKARVVANLPYYISTAILQRLIQQRQCLSEMMLMLQREVVERITAPPGTSERGFLSVLVEAYCEAEALFDVAPAAFNPMPKVWSTVVRLRTRRHVAAEVKDEALLWRVVSVGFAQRRKTIFNNLRAAPVDLRSLIEMKGGAARLLEAAQIEPQRRAETLKLDEWGRVAHLLEE
ncbi:MAG TPA: 16S rRNA (adenine(1518)-N(6)/adenine(1519)-N(6))-dimethyltransferase RsmA [Pyrinomonadaceae bacterium]|jgi:16S rRNA (adenine1518-N6/adenine1519-N6)-dimethyltransferase